MQGTYNLWLVAFCYIIGFTWACATFQVRDRLIAAPVRRDWAWFMAGALVLGLGIWSVQFVALLAFRVYIPLVFDIPIALAAAIPAIAACAIIITLLKDGTLSDWRSLIAAAALACGMSATHYIATLAIRIEPGVQYDPGLSLAALAVAFGFSYVIMALTFSQKPRVSRLKMIAGAVVAAAGIFAIHWVCMLVTQFASAAIWTVAPTAIANSALGSMIAFSAVIVLIAVTAVAAYENRAR